MLKLSNRFWFQLHGWFSLPVWVVFCFVCLTGTIAVISHEITWLANPNARALNPDNLPAKPVPELIAAVEKAYPSAHVTTVMALEPYLTNAIVFTDHDKPYAIAYVNQYTGQIQQVNQGLTFIGFMRALHGWLYFPWQNNYSVGYYLVCAMALVMLGALLTGLVVYKRFWQAFSKPKVRLNQGKRTIFADLHRLIGAWSIWFLLLMSLTGLWYLLQAMFWHNDIQLEAHPPLVAESQLPLAGTFQARPYSLSDALTMAQKKFADFQPTYVMPPEHFRDTYKLYGAGDFIFYDQYAYGVVVNPWNGQIESTRSPANMSVLQTLSHIADPLHYGTIGGLWTKVIWFVFGLMLTAMSITGFLMWRTRVFKHAMMSEMPKSDSSDSINSNATKPTPSII